MGVYTNTMRYTGTSGVDVESMVQALMKAEGAKADKLYKQKTRLEWQQNALRTLGTNVRTFRDSYLSFSSANTIMNMRSTKAYLSKSVSGTFTNGNTPMSSGTSSSTIKLGSSSTISVNSDALSGSYDINIKSVASKQTNVGTTMPSKAEGTVDIDYKSIEAGDYLDIKVNGTAQRITFDANDLDKFTATDVDGNKTYSGDNFRDLLQRKINTTFGTIGGENKVEVGGTGDKISLSSNPTIGSTFAVTFDSGVINSTKASTSGDLMSGVSIDGKNFATQGTDVYTLGSDLTVKIDFGTGDVVDADSYMKKLNEELKSHNIKATNSNGKITFENLNGAGTVSVKDVDRTITGPAVEVDGKELTSSFGFAQKLSGVTNSIASENGKYTSKGVDTYTINGETIEIEFGGELGMQTKEHYMQDLNAKLQLLAKTSDGKTNLSASYDNAGNVYFTNADTSKPATIEMKREGVDSSDAPLTNQTFNVDETPTELTGGASLAKKMGLTETNLSSTLNLNAQAGDGLLKFSFGTSGNVSINTAGMSYKQVMEEVSKQSGGKVNMTFNSTSNAFSLSATEAGSNNKITFSASSTHETTFNIATKPQTEAKDASLTITTPDGNTTNIVRDTNVISYGGMTFNLDSGLQSTIDNDINKGELKTTITVGSDTSSAYDNIKNFINSYNTLLEELKSATSTARAKSGSYSYYEPLTQEEEGELSESQLSKYESKAKQGVLYRNSEVERLTAKMREITTTGVTLADGTKLSLGSIGISTGDYSAGGKLFITDEEKLRSALENNADGVAKLFTDSKNGVSEKLYSAIDDAVGSDGYITKNVGFTDSVYVKNNFFTKQIESKADELSRLNELLIEKENHYYKMFSYMENSINNANSQMASLGY